MGIWLSTEVSDFKMIHFWSVSPAVMPKIPQNFPPAAGPQTVSYIMTLYTDTHGRSWERVSDRILRIENSVVQLCAFSNFWPYLQRKCFCVGNCVLDCRWEVIEITTLSEISPPGSASQFPVPTQRFTTWILHFNTGTDHVWFCSNNSATAVHHHEADTGTSSETAESRNKPLVSQLVYYIIFLVFDSEAKINKRILNTFRLIFRK